MQSALNLSKKSVFSHDFLIIRSPENLSKVRLFTARKYNNKYGATLKNFMPQAICHLDKNRFIRAAAGFQSASRSLYLEQYLKEPVENAIARSFDTPIPKRSQIVELGNFAASTPGATRHFIIRLGKYLLKNNFHWLVLTATQSIKASFEKMGLESAMVVICDAKIDRLKDNITDWGTYYENNPKVIAVDIKKGLNELLKNEVVFQLLQVAQEPIEDVDIPDYLLEEGYDE
jgi:hypothetical protein